MTPSAAAPADLIWLAGGTDGVRPFAELWSSASGESWARSVVSWPARDSAVLLAFQGALWLLGGRVAPAAAAASSSVLSLSASPAGGGGSSSSAGQAARLLLLARHGGGAAAAAPAVADVWRTYATGPGRRFSWSLVEPAAVWGARYAFGAVTLGGRIIVAGGAVVGSGGGGTTLLSDAWGSTPNLLCESIGQVCNSHGTCTPGDGGRRRGMRQQQQQLRQSAPRGRWGDDEEEEADAIPLSYVGGAYDEYYASRPWMAQYREAAATTGAAVGASERRALPALLRSLLARLACGEAEGQGGRTGVEAGGELEDELCGDTEDGPPDSPAASMCSLARSSTLARLLDAAAAAAPAPEIAQWPNASGGCLRVEGAVGEEEEEDEEGAPRPSHLLLGTPRWWPPELRGRLARAMPACAGSNGRHDTRQQLQQCRYVRHLLQLAQKPPRQPLLLLLSGVAAAANCSCFPGFSGETCESQSCTTGSATCVHGKCMPPPGGGGGGNGSSAPPVCVCTDPQLWNGSACNVPVCSRACGPHGVCSSPGQCTCESGWVSSRCNVVVRQEERAHAPRTPCGTVAAAAAAASCRRRGCTPSERGWRPTRSRSSALPPPSRRPSCSASSRGTSRRRQPPPRLAGGERSCSVD